MNPLVIALVVLAVGVLGALLFIGVQRTRHPRREDGVASFQRHLDALSPEARRQVIDRVKKGER